MRKYITPNNNRMQLFRKKRPFLCYKTYFSPKKRKIAQKTKINLCISKISTTFAADFGGDSAKSAAMLE